MSEPINLCAWLFRAKGTLTPRTRQCPSGSHHIAREIAAKRLRHGGRVKETSNHLMPLKVAPLIPMRYLPVE